MENTEIARSLFQAFSDGDTEAVRRFCAPGLQARQNLNPPFGLDALIALSTGVKQLVPDLHYVNAIRAATAGGFVEEHDVCGTLPNGEKLKIAACVVAEVRAGQVHNLREYLDTAAAGGLMRALAAKQARD